MGITEFFGLYPKHELPGLSVWWLGMACAGALGLADDKIIQRMW